MLGAIAGDIIGSVHEQQPCRDPHFPLFTGASRFTDDTVLTVATAHALLSGMSYRESYRKYGQAFPDAGYGASFRGWLFAEEAGPYGSWGNGSAMRVSPVAWASGSLRGVLSAASESAVVTHDHPEGIKGAQAVAAAVFWARNGISKEEIRSGLIARFGYDLNRSAREISRSYAFDVSCQGSVPEALICFFDSENFENAIRLAVMLGGDADTQACIAGAVAEAFYGGLPTQIVDEVCKRIPSGFLKVIEKFQSLHRFPAYSRNNIAGAEAGAGQGNHPCI